MSNSKSAVSNSLSSDFNSASSGIEWAAIGLAGFFVFGYVDNFFFDPLFFDVIHDPTNATSQAFKAFLNDWFGWTHELFGLKGDSGLLQMDWAQDILEPYYDLTSVPDAYEVFENSDDIDFDAW